jgi:uncharacterized protein
MDPHSVNLVIYHAECSDGFGAAWSAWKLLGSRATYVPAFFGEPPPDVRGKRVVCLDFSYDNATTKRLIQEAESFLVIDHHKSAMIMLHDVPEARFDMTKSGAMLGWEFFHPGKEAPKFIKYIQDRDLWQFELPYSKEFSAAFDMVPFEFEDYDSYCDDSTFDDAVKRGSYILPYRRSAVAKMAHLADKRSIRGYEAAVINSSQWISEIGDHLGKQSPIAVIWWFNHKEKNYKISLRTSDDNIDVSEIAKTFGGGGHRTAAGFIHLGASIEEIFDVK